jgi:hypothetical protein
LYWVATYLAYEWGYEHGAMGGQDGGGDGWQLRYWGGCVRGDRRQRPQRGRAGQETTPRPSTLTLTTSIPTLFSFNNATVIMIIIITWYKTK